MRAVYVEWEDACDLDTTPWSDIDDAPYTPLLVTQVGLVVYDGPEGMICYLSSGIYTVFFYLYQERTDAEYWHVV